MKKQTFNHEESEKIYRKFQNELNTLMAGYLEEIKKIHQKIADKKIQNILKKIK